MAIHLKLNHHHCSRPSGTAQPCPSYSNLTFSQFHRHHFPFPNPSAATPLTHFLSPPNPILKHKLASLVVARRALLSSSTAVLQDVGATAFVLTGGYTLVSVFDNLTDRNIISQKLSRKLVHIISGLLFAAAWPLFSTSPEARYFASLAPFINCLRLVVNGLSLTTDEGLIKSVTREGKPEELLKGPLYYVLTLAFCAIIFWRDSPVGLLLLSMMSGGDGKLIKIVLKDHLIIYLTVPSSFFFYIPEKVSLLTMRATGIADIMGRKFGYVKLPYNQRKSWVGSISMLIFGFLISIGMLYYFSVLGYFEFDWNLTAKRVAVVSFVATVVESLPTAERIDDNISVPLATLVTAYFFM